MYQQPNHSYASTDSLRRLSSNNPFRQFQQQNTSSSSSSYSHLQPQPNINLNPLQPYQQPHHSKYQDQHYSSSSISSNNNNQLNNRRKSSSLSRQSTNSTTNTSNSITNTNNNSNSHFDNWVEKNKNLIRNQSSDDDDDYDEYYSNNNNDYVHNGRITNTKLNYRKSSDQDSQISPNKILSYYQNTNTSIDSINQINHNQYNSKNNNGNINGQANGKINSKVTIKRSSSKLTRPIQLQAFRSDSDSSVNYNSNNRTMKSNNPFASAINDSDDIYASSEREPLYQPPPQSQQQQQSIPQNPQHRSTPPARPPKPQQDDFAPPSYEEAAGKEAAKREYRREKENNGTSSSSSNGHTREHRSSSDPHKHRSSSHHNSRSHRKSSSSRNKSPSKKKVETIPAKNLDTIDKLDVTGFFGGGFHHDGPFDACTPHRNKNKKQAPVMAFPVDGPNNSIAGSGGNIDKDAQMKLAFGNYDDIDKNEIVGRKSSIVEESPAIKTNRITNDPSTSIYTPKQNPSVINFDATAKTQPIHGYSTEGLGSTTFIDGAPAPAPIRAKSLSRTGRNGNNNKEEEISSSPQQQNSFLRRVKSLKHRNKS
ncbi:uncharacterized protein KGF55_000380 [Candida pseudojiufengensis]|uniref:uncharacterized protein n=1 Tax=Candida pseudojiufengensis TaxID=497109 RepID=UPI0022241145|nr:uncharacterized protein KGF55_000380 [Candida pseudojiufengensis]KAI5966971.1 hypothetical protein KGF55_000380 [Candida pseudojiufengensis]